MALKYVISNATYDLGKSEYTTVSNKYKRLNYIASGKTYQLGLATDSTAAQYSPLKIKISDSTYYIGKSTSTVVKHYAQIATNTIVISYYTYHRSCYNSRRGEYSSESGSGTYPYYDYESDITSQNGIYTTSFTGYNGKFETCSITMTTDRYWDFSHAYKTVSYTLSTSSHNFA